MPTEFKTTSHIPGTGFFAVVESDPRQLEKGTLIQYERLGFQLPTAKEAFGPGWGINASSNDLDFRDQYAQPFAANEIIRKFDTQRCISIDPVNIVPPGVAYELVHWAIPTGAVGFIEQLPTIFEVTALDANGIPIFTYGELNGENLCIDELVHPDPAVLIPLKWQFRLVYTDSPSSDSPARNAPLNYRSAISADLIGGQNIIPPYSDLRYGHRSDWGKSEQYAFPSSSVIRYWVVFYGPTERFRVRIGGRLSGFWQLAGRRSAALDSVITRRL